jgi:SpoVK/Ycf46/Vps4 family AAA+-type ATPase
MSEAMRIKIKRKIRQQGKVSPRQRAVVWVINPGMAEVHPSVLLLIPAYNEEDRIEPVLRDYGRFFRQNYEGKFQLVVVLNG